MDHRPKTLIIGPNWLGDIILSIPLLKSLRSKGHHITYMAPKSYQPIINKIKEIDLFIPTSFTSGKLEFRKRRVLGHSLRQTFDQSYILPNSWKSAHIAYAAKIPHRAGFLGEVRWGMLTHIHRKPLDPLISTAQKFLSLSGASLTPEYYPQLQINNEQQQKLINTYGLNPHKKILALCPGAIFGPSKRWPLYHFISLTTFFPTHEWDIYLFGGPLEKNLADEFSSRCPREFYNFVGKLSLDEMTDLLSLASVSVTNDSGLLHVSAALNLKIVALYGSTHPKIAPPLCKHHRIHYLNLPCQPCKKRICPLSHLKCLHDVTAEEVYQSIEQLLETH